MKLEKNYVCRKSKLANCLEETKIKAIKATTHNCWFLISLQYLIIYYLTDYRFKFRKVLVQRTRNNNNHKNEDQTQRSLLFLLSL